VAAAAGLRAERRARRRALAGSLLRSGTFVAGLAVVLFWILDALLWRAIVPHDPYAASIDALPLSGPSSAHWLGTDDLGRDVFSRMLAGAAPVLTVAPLATALGVGGGVALGLAMAYFGGIVDDVLSRLVDAVLSLPGIMVALLALTVVSSSVTTVIMVIGLIFIPIVTRTARAAALAERQREYVVAARLRGDNPLYTMYVEILPNIAGPIVVEATVRLGYAIFTAATLSFLGQGLQIPSPDWGLTVAVERVNLTVNAWTVLAPAIALATLVVGVNMLTDGLRRVLEE
jgi:peptide/nickel transport system permease protein